MILIMNMNTAMHSLLGAKIVSAWREQMVGEKDGRESELLATGFRPCIALLEEEIVKNLGLRQKIEVQMLV